MLKKILWKHSFCLKKNVKQFSTLKDKFHCATITTPIFYINSEPHIGHLYTLLLADCISRWHTFKEFRVVFTNGTDEHGQKVQKAANLKNLDLKSYCDTTSLNFLKMNKDFNTSITHFIRTTDKKHQSTVENIWKKIYELGFIHKRVYEGWYCVNEEAFIHERDLSKIENKMYTKAGHAVEWTTEENYVFDMLSFNTEIKNLLQKEKPCIPLHFNETLISKHLDDLKDISISRPKQRVSWGITTPNNEDQTIYVWMDALCNYLTALNYLEEDQLDIGFFENFIHVLGKDIVKFHTIFWPALLSSLNLPLPKKILIHDHWIYKGKKMSKSFGNVINPFKIMNKYGENAIRIYFLSEGPEYYDSEYDEKLLQKKTNDFIEAFINSLNRLFHKKIIPQGEIISVTWSYNEQDYQLFKEFDLSTKNFIELMDNFSIRKAYIEAEKKFDFINKFIAKTEVWRVSDESLKNKYIYMGFEMIRITALLLQCFVPNISMSILNSMNISEKLKSLKSINFRPIDKEKNDENFHANNDSNYFLKVNLEKRKDFFMKKIEK